VTDPSTLGPVPGDVDDFLTRSGQVLDDWELSDDAMRWTPAPDGPPPDEVTASDPRVRELMRRWDEVHPAPMDPAMRLHHHHVHVGIDPDWATVPAGEELAAIHRMSAAAARNRARVSRGLHVDLTTARDPARLGVLRPDPEYVAAGGMARASAELDAALAGVAAAYADTWRTVVTRAWQALRSLAEFVERLNRPPGVPYRQPADVAPDWTLVLPGGGGVGVYRTLPTDPVVTWRIGRHPLPTPPPPGGQYRRGRQR
jgi:hypothetical protein